MVTVRDKSTLTTGTLSNAADLTFSFLENGSIFAITHGGILVNQILGSPIDGGLGNIYIRRYEREGLSFFPVLGPASPGQPAVTDAASWQGSRNGVEYRCRLQLAPDA